MADGMAMSGEGFFYTEVGLGAAYALALAAVAIGWLPVTTARLKLAQYCFYVVAILVALVAVVWGSQTDMPWLTRNLIVGVLCAVAGIAAAQTARFLVGVNGLSLPAPPSPAATTEPRPGKGGSGTVIGNNARIYGGRGGTGVGGGDGGSGFVHGHNAVIVGGDAGNSGYFDKDGVPHGGAGGQSPLLRLRELGLETSATEFLITYSALRAKYAETHGGNAPNALPEKWTNARLAEMKSQWRVKNTASGFELVPAETR